MRSRVICSSASFFMVYYASYIIKGKYEGKNDFSSLIDSKINVNHRDKTNINIDNNHLKQMLVI